MASELVINSVGSPLGGRIGLTRCPGISGTLEADVRFIAGCGATVLLSLLTATELSRPRIGDIRRTATTHGLFWSHLPIVDMHTPDDQFEAAWQVVRNDLLARLRADQFIVLHCRAGLGRAGMIACRLVVDAGALPADALAQVRQARPGAVETRAQQAWVLGLNALPAQPEQTGYL